MKIMVIDDEYYAREALVSIINRSLSKQADVIIRSFDSAKNAIDTIPVFVPDVIFTDIRMDEMSGLELCEFVHQNYPSITLIIISGYADFGYAQKAIRYNVDRYLTKPVHEQDIQEILHQIMLKPSPVQQSSLSSDAINTSGKDINIVRTGERSNIIDASSCRLIRHYMVERNVFSLLEVVQESFDVFLSHYGCNKALFIKYFVNLFDIIKANEESLNQNEGFLNFVNDITKKAEQVSDIATATALMKEVLNYLKLVLSEEIAQETTLAEQIITYIENHYFDDLNMNDIARNVFFISPNYLSKLVNDATGLRFSKYLLKIRMENALKILSREDLSISEVAQLAGYNSESHFIQLFKKFYGTTPKNYRATLKEFPK